LVLFTFAVIVAWVTISPPVVLIGNVAAFEPIGTRNPVTCTSGLLDVRFTTTGAKLLGVAFRVTVPVAVNPLMMLDGEIDNWESINGVRFKMADCLAFP